MSNQLRTVAEMGEALRPLCYILHPATRETIIIRRGQDGWVPAGTVCSPECLNALLPRPPTQDEISAMKHGSLIGWNAPGCGPELWRMQRECRR